MIRSIHIENFRVLSGIHDFEFGEGIIGIVGPNGQGKSTLINSVAWTLYGSEALPLKARDPVSWGAKQSLCRVNLILNDGTNWTVERSMKSTGIGKAKLIGPEGEVKAEGSAPVTAAVAELLGVDREGFLISSFARQGELDRLRSMDSSPRMQTVLRLLGINQITKAIKTVREEGNEQRKSLEALRGHQIDSKALRGELDGLGSELAGLVPQIVSGEAKVEEIKAAIETLQAERSTLEPERRAYQSYLNELQSRKTTLLMCQSAHERASTEAQSPEPDKPKEPEYGKVGWVTPEQVEESKGWYLKIRESYLTLKAEMDNLVATSASMKESCPTCGRPFDDADHIEREKKRIEQRISILESEMDAVAEAGQVQKDDWDRLLTAQAESVVLNQTNARLEADFRMAIRSYEVAMAHRAQAQERLDRTAGELADAQSALDALKPVEDVGKREQEINHNLDGLNVQLQVAMGQVSIHMADKGVLEMSMQRITDQLASASETESKAKSLNKTVVSHETTAEQLGGLKEKLIGQIIPSLNERASALVDMMTDGKYTEISLTPDYEIEYRTPLGDYKNFLNLSGGEQVVFALALRLAIADLRAGNLGVVFLDEAMSGLSSEDGRQESVWQAVESLTGRFGQVFLITHVEAFKDRAPFTIRL